MSTFSKYSPDYSGKPLHTQHALQKQNSNVRRQQARDELYASLQKSTLTLD